jgi:hypothetical protein
VPRRKPPAQPKQAWRFIDEVQHRPGRPARL